MGLDMYLYKRTYVTNDEWVKPQHRTEVEFKRAGESKDSSKVRYIIEEEGYWRKANAIHRWFVENVQGGNDDCKEYPVSREKLVQLKRDCEVALTGQLMAESVMPTQEGFFFGSTEYDEYYTEDLKHTIAVVDGALKDVDAMSDFYYASSW
mgnify:FL=1